MTIAFKMVPSILLIGLDWLLVETRRLILERSGYKACVAFNLLELEQVALSAPVDLFLLCNSLSPEARTAALALIHERWPEARVLVLASTRSAFDLADQEEIFLAREGPSKLVEALRTLFAVDLPRPEAAANLHID